MLPLNKVPKFEIGERYRGVGEVKGITFNLLKRVGDWCLFRRSDNFFEVIKVKQQAEDWRYIGGSKVHFKPREVFPTGDAWLGKCTDSKEKAESYFLNRIANEERK